MSMVLPYLIKVSVTATVTWIMYAALFRRLTFFRFNRFFLVGGLVLSFIIPFIPLPAPGIEVLVPSFEEAFSFTASPVETGAGADPVVRKFSPVDIAGLFSLLVSLAYLVWIVIQFARVKMDRKTAVVVKRGRLRLVIKDRLPSAFTLFRSVYIDRYTYENRLLPVIRHEWIHAREGHSFDLLFMEFAFALLWFNPFVFLLRKAVRENLEFLADEQSSGNGDLVPYLELLRSELLRTHTVAIASYFSSTTFKKRIIMLTKNRSDKKARWNYFLMLPVIAVVFLALHAPAGSMKSVGIIQNGIANEVPVTGKKGIPSVFPLSEKYRDQITWDYGIKAKNPVSGEVTEHGGIDIKAPEGTEVFASGDGIVSQVEEKEGWGKLIIIKHDQGYSSWYAHLKDFSVKAGDAVKKGQVIGYVGNTGMSTGPHLHYEVRLNDKRVDPNDFF